MNDNGSKKMKMDDETGEEIVKPQQQGEGDQNPDPDHGTVISRPLQEVLMLTDPPQSPVREKYEQKQNLTASRSDMAPETLHPLLMDHVLKKVFATLGWSYSNPDILSCRLVCKTWNYLITNRLKRKGLVRTIEFGNEDGDEETRHSLKKFLIAMRHSICIPFNQYQFHMNFFTESNTRLFNDFLLTCGSVVTSLTLSIGRHFSLDMTAIYHLGNIQFPNLERLSIHCIHLNTRASDSEMISGPSFEPVSWLPQKSKTQFDHLLRFVGAALVSASLLEKFEFKLPSYHFDGDVAQIANSTFGHVFATDLTAAVTHLKLLMEIDGKDLLGLKRLKLKCLHLTFYGSNLTAEDLVDFLNSQANTLNKLKIKDLENSGSMSKLNLTTEFANVHTLDIKVGDFLKESLSYLRFFPNLEKLVLRNGRTKNPDFLLDDGFTHLKISHVELTYIVEGGVLAKRLIKCFPNITQLAVQVDGPDSVRAVEGIFECVTKLEELQLTFPRICSYHQGDPLFTGLSNEWCQVIRRSDEMLSVERQTNVLSVVRRRPCLENLGQLRKLTILSEAHAVFITDVTVHYALFRMPFLNELVIGYHNISPGCISLLRSRMQLTVTETGTGETGGNSLIQSIAVYFPTI